MYFPQTNHSILLENDAEHYILACFLYSAPNRDPALIQHKLAEQYGGFASEYPILAISTKPYIAHLPEYLNREQVLNDLLLWSVSNHISLWSWDHEHGWNHTPPGFKVNLEVRNYPLHLWHPQYFHLLVADFGLPLYVDEANSMGNDRSSLRISITCLGPSCIPPSSILLYKDRWRRCTISVLGWAYQGTQPLVEFGGSPTGGNLTSVSWPRDIHSSSQEDDRRNRETLNQAAQAARALQRSRQGDADGDGWHTLRQSPWSTGPQHRPGPGGKNLFLQGQILNIQPENSESRTSEQKSSYLIPFTGLLMPKILYPSMCYKMYPLRRVSLNTNRPSAWSHLILRGNSIAPSPIASSKISYKTKESLPHVTILIKATKINYSTCKPQPYQCKATVHKTPKNIPIPINPIQKEPLIRQPQNQLKSILGPKPQITHFSSKPATFLNLNHHINHTQSISSLLTQFKHMDAADEELIRRFAGLQAGEGQSNAIVLPQEVAVRKNWEQCLAVRVCLERMVFADQFEKFMRIAWDVGLDATFTPKGRGNFLVEFHGKDEKNRVQYQGPWFYRNDLVVVAPCNSFADLELPITRAELWVQFHKSHAETLTVEGTKIITDLVGQPVSDPVWSSFNGRQFFKVKLSVSIVDPLKDRVCFTHPIQGEVEAYLVYEKLGRICNFCGLLGHEMNSCADRIRPYTFGPWILLWAVEANRGRPELANILNPTFGPWRTSLALIPTEPSTINSDRSNNAGNWQTGPKPYTGLKRSLTEFIHQPHLSGPTLQVPLNDPLLPQSENSFSQSDENGKNTSFNKRARSARPQSPPGFL